MSEATLVQFEINLHDLRKIVWRTIPGFLSWSTLVALVVLSFILPFWVAIFVIAFDVYVLIRAVYMSVHLVYAYRQIRMHKGIDWLSRCEAVRGDLHEYIALLKARYHNACRDESASKLQCIPMLEHMRSVQHMVRQRRKILDWNTIHHIVVIPTYNESLAVLEATVTALSKVEFPKERMHVVVGFEKRAGSPAHDNACALTTAFSHTFGTFLTTFHPDTIRGEKRVKSANATWALKKMEHVIREKGIEDMYVLVSNFDCDTIAPKEYFSYLTYAFVTHPKRYRISYQPIPVYSNNLWDAPAFSRVIAMGSTFWQMIESTRPERLVTFSSHSMTLRALKDVGYWQTDIISEDSRIFWQCLLHYNGHYQTYPLFITVSMDAALARTWWQTLKGQYKQKRRWAWGIENFPYMAEGFLNNSRIARSTKFVYLFRTLEGHFSWATVAIIVAGLGWLPVLFGGPEFHTTVLSYSLPHIARTLMTIAMVGLIVSATLTLLLLKPKDRTYSRLRYVGLVLQWALVPVIATALSAIPALDAETRLMLGRDLHFNVMEKVRR